MAKVAPHIPEDDIEAVAQQSIQDENTPADGDEHSHSNKIPEQTYEQLLYKYTSTYNKGEPANTFLDFDSLSRMNIVHLMNELAKYEQAMKKNEAAPQDIEHFEDLLHRYSKSVKVAMVIVFLLRCLHVSYRYSGPRILVQTLQVRGSSLRTFYNPVATTKFPEIYRDYEDMELDYLNESSEPKSGSMDPLRNFLRKA